MIAFANSKFMTPPLTFVKILIYVKLHLLIPCSYFLEMANFLLILHMICMFRKLEILYELPMMGNGTGLKLLQHLSVVIKKIYSLPLILNLIRFCTNPWTRNFIYIFEFLELFKHSGIFDKILTMCYFAFEYLLPL